MKPIITVQIEQQNNVHTRLKVFNRGGLAGNLVVNTQDAREIIRRLENKRLNTIGHISNTLLSDGYSRIIALGDYQHDQEIAEKTTCSYCSGKCFYEGFRKDNSYLAYIVCTECGAAFEF